MATFNRKQPYSEIYGHSYARYYQNGAYFDGAGNEVSAARAAQPAGLTEREMEELRKEGLEADESISGESHEGSEPAPPQGPTKTEEDSGTEGAEAAEEKPSRDEGWQERYNDAIALHANSLKAMVKELREQMISDGVSEEELEGIPYSGEGAKEKNAEWLADHTTS